MITPTIIIHLGEFGKEVLSNSVKYYFNESYFKLLIRNIFISNSFIIRDYTATSESFSMDQAEEINLSKDNFADNEILIASLINEYISNLFSQDAMSYYINNNLTWPDKIQIIIVGNLYDTESPYLLLHLLRTLNLHVLSKYSTSCDIHILGRIKSIVGSEMNAQNYDSLINYIFLQEFEALQVSNKMENKYIWLVDTCDEKGVFISSLEELSYNVSNFISILIECSEKIISSIKSNIYELPIGGKYPYYSTFGISNIIFPKKQILSFLFSYGKLKELDQLSSSSFTKQSRIEIDSLVKSFLTTHDFFKFPSLLLIDSEKNQIFTPFIYNCSNKLLSESNFINNKSYKINDITYSQNVSREIFDEISNEKDQYDESTFLNSNIKIPSAIKTLNTHFEIILLESLKNLLSDVNKSINYSISFLLSLVDEEWEYLENDLLESSKSLDDVEEDIRKYYHDLTPQYHKRDSLTREINHLCDILKKHKNETARLKKEIEESKKTNRSGTPDFIKKESELNSMLDTINLNKQKITNNQHQLAQVENEINDFKRKVESTEYREYLMEQEQINIEQQITDLKIRISDIDLSLINLYQSKNYLIEAKLEYIKKWFVPFSIIFAILLITLLIFPSKSISNIYFILLSLIGVAYYIIAGAKLYIKYVIKFKKLLHDIKLNLINKSNLFGKYIDMRNFYYSKTFEHKRYTYSYQWIVNFKSYVRTQIKFLKELRIGIIDLQSVTANSVSNFEFSSHLTDKLIVTKNDCINFYNNMIIKSILYTNNTDSPIFNIYNDYIINSGFTCLDNMILSSIDLNIKEYLDNLGIDSIILGRNEYFAPIYSSKATIQHVIDTSLPLLRTSKPIAANEDLSESKNYFVGWHINYYKDYLAKEIDIIDSIYEYDNNKFGILRIKTGFTVFQIMNVNYFKENYNLFKKTTLSLDEFYLEPSNNSLSLDEQITEYSDSEFNKLLLMIGIIINKITYKNDVFVANSGEYCNLNELLASFKSINGVDLQQQLQDFYYHIDDIDQLVFDDYKIKVVSFMNSFPNYLTEEMKVILTKHIETLIIH